MSDSDLSGGNVGFVGSLMAIPFLFAWCYQACPPGIGNRPVVEDKIYYRSAQAALLENQEKVQPITQKKIYGTVISSDADEDVFGRDGDISVRVRFDDGYNGVLIFKKRAEENVYLDSKLYSKGQRVSSFCVARNGIISSSTGRPSCSFPQLEYQAEKGGK